MKKYSVLIVLLIVLLFVIYYFNMKDQSTKSVRPHSQTKIMKTTKEAYDLGLDGTNLIDQMIDQMSTSEKIGQLIFTGISGDEMSKETTALVNEYKLGGIILFSNNLTSPKQSIKLLNQIKVENKQNDLPIFLGVDQEGGRVERLPNIKSLPSSLDIATHYSQEKAFEIGELLAKQLRAFGFNLNFAPVLDVNSNPNNPVIGDRSFGSSAEVVSKWGIQIMKGMQSRNVITAVKHFPGHGDTTVDSHIELPKVDKSYKELLSLELIPFQDAIEAGADIVMTGHILLPQIDATFPASLSKQVITNVLRNDMEFSGVVMTDDLTMQAITNQFRIEEAAVHSIQAGTDIVLMAHHYDDLVAVYKSLQQAVKDGDITEERINESLRRIIKLKWDYDLADEQVESIQTENLNQLIKSYTPVNE